MGGVDLGVVEAERAVWAVIYFIGIVFPDRPGEARPARRVARESGGCMAESARGLLHEYMGPMSQI